MRLSRDGCAETNARRCGCRAMPSRRRPRPGAGTEARLCGDDPAPVRPPAGHYSSGAGSGSGEGGAELAPSVAAVGSAGAVVHVEKAASVRHDMGLELHLAPTLPVAQSGSTQESATASGAFTAPLVLPHDVWFVDGALTFARAE